MHTHTNHTTSTQVVLHTGMHSWLCYHTRCTKNKCHLAVEICTHAQSRQHVRIAHTRELRTQAGTAGCANTHTHTHTLTLTTQHSHEGSGRAINTWNRPNILTHVVPTTHAQQKRHTYTHRLFLTGIHNGHHTNTHTDTHTAEDSHM